MVYVLPDRTDAQSAGQPAAAIPEKKLAVSAGQEPTKGGGGDGAWGGGGDGRAGGGGDGMVQRENIGA